MIFFCINKHQANYTTIKIQCVLFGPIMRTGCSKHHLNQSSTLKGKKYVFIKKVDAYQDDFKLTVKYPTFS